jgi:hypothetical protein
MGRPTLEFSRKAQDMVQPCLFCSSRRGKPIGGFDVPSMRQIIFGAWTIAEHERSTHNARVGGILRIASQVLNWLRRSEGAAGSVPQQHQQ